jgi:hypothetical protein
VSREKVSRAGHRREFGLSLGDDEGFSPLSLVGVPSREAKGGAPMSRLTLVFLFTTLLAATSALILTMGAAAHAIPIVINNGLAPPHPANVINDASYSGDFDVYVRNVGCPPAWPSGGADWACPSPGAPTEVALVQGGAVGATWKCAIPQRSR